MNKSIAIALLLVAACKGDHKSDTPVEEGKAGANPTKDPANADALGQYEAKMGKQFSGVLVDKTGVWVARAKVATLEELSSKPDVITKALAATDQHALATVVFLLKDEPASLAKAALEQVGATGHGKFTTILGDAKEGCQANLAPRQEKGEQVNMSITVRATNVFVGLSRVNEFRDVTSEATLGDGLQKALMTEKASAFFADRNDVELGAEKDAKAGLYLAAFSSACKAGFINITLLEPANLSAKVGL